MIKKGDKSEPSNTFISTFSAPTPPKFVKAAYLRIPVDVFVPNPLRCYKCQKFGHGRDACKRPAACAKCGGAMRTLTVSTAAATTLAILKSVPSGQSNVKYQK